MDDVQREREREVIRYLAENFTAEDLARRLAEETGWFPLHHEMEAWKAAQAAELEVA
jgi:hypothetical protein